MLRMPRADAVSKPFGDRGQSLLAPRRAPLQAGVSSRSKPRSELEFQGSLARRVLEFVETKFLDHILAPRRAELLGAPHRYPRSGAVGRSSSSATEVRNLLGPLGVPRLEFVEPTLLKKLLA